MFELIVDLISRGGYAGVFALMALENIFPPIPSEIIMPLAGFAAARGDLGMLGVVVAGTAGSVLGTLPWYYGARWFGKERILQIAGRHGRWLTVTPEDIDRSIKTFGRHGKAAVFFGRLIPAIRTLISVPAGVARMRLVPFLLYSLAGSAIWTALLASSGFVLQSRHALVAQYLDPVSKIVIGLLVAVYVYRLITFKPDRAL